MRLAGSNDKVIGLVLLHHEPHGFDIVSGKTPVAFGAQITQEQRVLETLGNACCCTSDFSSYECLASPGRFVVEENAVAAEHAVAFTIIDRLEVAVHFCTSVGASGVEWRCFLLGCFSHLAVHFAGGGLIEAGINSCVPE